MPIMGIIMPKMGSRKTKSRGWREQSTEPTSMADALFTNTQQRVLGLLYGQPERSFFANELIELTRSGSGAVQRELARLVESGLISDRLIGRERHYQADPTAPIFNELRSIIVKIAGFREPLRAALAKLGDRIVLALLYGSVVKGTATAKSDIDLLLVGDDLTLEEVYTALAPAERQLARKISPTLYTVSEFQKRRKGANPFLTRVLADAYSALIGNPNDLSTR